jgi:hypothetical protein
MGHRDNLGYRGFAPIVVSKCPFAGPCDLANEFKRGGTNLFILRDFLFGP